MWPLSDVAPPPIPKRVREYLRDYPDLLAELQRALNSVVLKPSPATPSFELAVWELEDALSSFSVDAQAELRAAEATGDAALIASASKKESATGYARASGYGMLDLSELESYFSRGQGVT